MRTDWLAALLLAGCTAALSVAAETTGDSPADLFDEAGYRMDRFIAPVPETAPGAVTLSTVDARALHAKGAAVFIDVLPAPQRPSGLPPDTLWLPPDHASIPDAVWLPNVGFGHLSDRLAAYLRDQLERLTAGDPERPLALFCRAHCWMSWNAAKRVSAMGYRRVYWYPDGTTGWSAAGLPLERVKPVPLD